MEISTENWGYLRSLAGGLAEASSLSRGEWVQIDREWVDATVERIRQITDKPHTADGKPQAHRREKRG